MADSSRTRRARRSALRHAQGFDAYEILKEYELLGGILFSYLAHAAEHFAEVGATIEESSEHQRELVIRVRDNGLGVPEAKRGQLFQHFFRAHETVTEAEGTGLGLSIVRDTAESLGGRAWAEFPAEGSVFAFSLPLPREEPEVNG